MFEKCKVVMLPTNQKTSIFLSKRDNRLHYWFKGNTPNNVDNYQHLYILSHSKIKKGDWCIMLDDLGNVFSSKPQQFLGEKENHSLNNNLRKIIATTDTLSDYKAGIEAGLFLPQSSESFIKEYVEEYNKGNVITKVVVEYEKQCTELKPKINEDNTINIKQIKNSWSREEVLNLLIKL